MKPLLLLLLITPTILLSQVWEKTYGAGFGSSVEQIGDGSYIIIGTGYNPAMCTYIINTNIYGDTLWTKYHTINDFGLYSSGCQTLDGGYIITGATQLANSNYQDVFLLKTDSNGDTMWSKVYGGNNYDVGLSVQQTTDSGYIITGWSDSFSTSHDIYLIKTDSDGEMIWNKSYGGVLQDVGCSVIQTNDGGYLITGYSIEFDGDFAWSNLQKTDSVGNVLWTTTFDEEPENYAFSGKQTNDGGYIITGCSKLSDNSKDLYLKKISVNGDINWFKTYGESNTSECGRCVQQTMDEGYIIAGYKLTTNNYYDAYLVRTDSYGDTLWTRTYGGLYNDKGIYVQQTINEGFILTGFYSNYTNQVAVWLIKTDENGLINFTTDIPLTKPNRKLIKTLYISGKEINDPKYNQPYIEIYDDGTTKKQMKIK